MDEHRVEEGAQFLDLGEIGPYGGVQHLGEEPQQRVVAVREAEPGVGEDPVVVPVERVQDAMLVDVATGRAKPRVGAWQRVEVVEAAEELGLVQYAAPDGPPLAESLDKAPTSDLGDAHGRGNSAPPQGR